MRYEIIALIFIMAFSAVVFQEMTPTQPQVENATTYTIYGDECDFTVYNGIRLPDKDCTPGSTFDNVSLEQLCEVGYTDEVRDVSTKTKDEVYEAYGITNHSGYIIEHLVALQLSGDNNKTNLYPNPKEDAYKKTKLEYYLRKGVCNGTYDLTYVQERMSDNWVMLYEERFGQVQ